MSGPILIISDVHTRYEVIDAQVRHAEESLGRPIDQVFVTGDFGFFRDTMREHFERGGRSFLRPVACIEGNHEDHAELPDLASRYSDVVTFVPRGAIHRLGGWRGLCLGGARYMDAAITPRGCEITDHDLQACLAHDSAEVDLVLTHDCPAGIGVPSTPGLEHYGTPGVPELERLAERYRPRWWFFGHHHQWFDREAEGTRYLGLPESWTGYALLDEAGEVSLVDHEVKVTERPWWKGWF
ncbi:MAG: hypothetical protein GY838_02245 [bacterium]|nr:hypothetical protein [bacterium]